MIPVFVDSFIPTRKQIDWSGWDTIFNTYILIQYRQYLDCFCFFTWVYELFHGKFWIKWYDNNMTIKWRYYDDICYRFRYKSNSSSTFQIFDWKKFCDQVDEISGGRVNRHILIFENFYGWESLPTCNLKAHQTAKCQLLMTSSSFSFRIIKQISGTGSIRPTSLRNFKILKRKEHFVG